MMTYTRETMPVVPLGKVRLTEAGDVGDDMMRSVTLIREAPGAIHRNVPVRLVSETRGYTIAGSCLRWQEAHYSVLFELDGATYGQQYSFTEAGLQQANAHYVRLTHPDTVKSYNEINEKILIACAKVNACQQQESRKNFIALCKKSGLNPWTKKARQTFRWYRGPTITKDFT